MTATTATRPAIARTIGKPFDYARLGRAFSEGEAFMRGMSEAAIAAIRAARAADAVRKLTCCPVCESDGLTGFVSIADHEYAQCGACGHVFVSTVVDEATRTRFFAQSASYSAGYCDEGRLQFRLDQIARPKVNYVEQHAAGRGAWLDIGCGAGEVIAEAQSRGWRCVGLELSAASAQFGRERLRVDIRPHTLEEHIAQSRDARYDVVSAFGVIHCLEDPVAFVRAAAGLLASNGVFVMELSNADSVTADAVRTFPNHPTRSSFNPLTTLHQFSDRSVERLCERAGLTPAAVWQYGTDAYEVLNHLNFAIPQLESSPLFPALLSAAQAQQAAWDEQGRGSHRLWIARPSTRE
ncbi:MAG: class I SAM-dependent methyltransferase [Phycisphaerales bacterium]|nr:class I SAM-dependent methyltransferase [Phycisphaerales bacterium]